MSVSPEVARWIANQIASAISILSRPNSTASERSVARYTIQMWRSQ